MRCKNVLIVRYFAIFIARSMRIPKISIPANMKTGVIIHIGIPIAGDTAFALIENPKATIDVSRYSTGTRYMIKLIFKFYLAQ